MRQYVSVIQSTLVQVMACCLTAPSHYLNPIVDLPSTKSSGIYLRVMFTFKLMILTLKLYTLSIPQWVWYNVHLQQPTKDPESTEEKVATETQGDQPADNTESAAADEQNGMELKNKWLQVNGLVQKKTCLLRKLQLRIIITLYDSMAIKNVGYRSQL